MGGMGDEAGRDASGQLERLADELSRRDLRVILAPDSDGTPALDVISPRPTPTGSEVSGGRVHWHDGAFWWSLPEKLPADTVEAARKIAAALRWTQRYPGLAAAAAPDDS